MEASGFTHTTAHGEHCDLDDRRVSSDRVRQFGRIDVEAARGRHVVGAVEPAEVALLVETSDVAGLHPAIDDALGSRLVSSEICNSACGGCEPGTSLVNHCGGSNIATGSSSVCP
jgi:hypothetical protein